LAFHINFRVQFSQEKRTRRIVWSNGVPYCHTRLGGCLTVTPRQEGLPYCHAPPRGGCRTVTPRQEGVAVLSRPAKRGCRTVTPCLEGVAALSRPAAVLCCAAKALRACTVPYCPDCHTGPSEVKNFQRGRDPYWNFFFFRMGSVRSRD
jgi:hypothetical protein